MATVGLDSLYYAVITEDPDTGYETYGTPVKLSKAITADLSIEIAEAILWADDSAAEVMREFQSGTMTLNVADLATSVVSDLTGAAVDDAGLLVFSSTDAGSAVAVGFRARKPNGKYRYFWIYKTKFGVPSTSLQTKEDGIEFVTPEIVGTIMIRNKPDERGMRPWKIEATDGDAAVSASTISTWFDAVVEPTFGTTGE